jgi:hypothetical protein
MMKRILLFLICVLFTLDGFTQTVNSPSASSYPQSTANQTVSGFSVSGFNSTATLLITIGLVNPPSGTTLRLNTTSGVTASTGYNLAANFTRISFTGTQANVNTVLSSLRLNTGSIPGNVYIAVTATENPVGFFYLPSNGHFYRPISTGTTYTGARSAAAATTFKGQTGYLVTITSADEDAFIFNNVPQSSIWFALTDEAVEGQWRINAGPESGTLIKTSNGQFTGNIAGQYNNWAPGEPNNSGNEDYAVTKWNGSQWNDLPNNFSCAYVIEYGTWTDPANQTFTDFFTGFVTHQIACSPGTSPNPPTVVNGSRNLAGTVTLSASAPAGSVVDWYANSSGGNVLSGGLGVSTFTTPSISTTTTYHVQSRNTSTGCVSSTRTPVTATVVYPVMFTYNGQVLNADNTGVSGISVKLMTKLKASSVFSLSATVSTNVNGSFNITTSLDTSLYNFRIVIENLTAPAPDYNDALFFNQKVLSQVFVSNDYYRMNTNADTRLTISDVYLMHQKINGTGWPVGVPSYRLFTQQQWSIISSSSANLSSSFPGLQTVTLTSPIAGGSSTFYLIKTGKIN